jgi:hypothetical protein
MLTAKERGE